MQKLDCGWFYFKDVAKEIKNTYIIPLWKYKGERVVIDAPNSPRGGMHVAYANTMWRKKNVLKWNQVHCSRHPGRNLRAMLGGSLRG